MSDNFEEVVCSKCKECRHIPVGSLTEEQKRGYLCAACQEVVLERQVIERDKKQRDLLVD